MGITESLVEAFGDARPAALHALAADIRVRRAMAPTSNRQAFCLALDATTNCFHFLNQLQAKTTAEHYNRLASLFDLGSVGSVALQNVLADRHDRLQRLLAGGLSESLMLIGSLQYIKAWEQEIRALHNEALWHLYDIFWDLSEIGQPSLSPEERRRELVRLLAPCTSASLSMPQQSVLLGWLFQIALLTALVKGEGCLA
jgi:hypothetical protein